MKDQNYTVSAQDKILMRFTGKEEAQNWAISYAKVKGVRTCVSHIETRIQPNKVLSTSSQYRKPIPGNHKVVIG